MNMIPVCWKPAANVAPVEDDLNLQARGIHLISTVFILGDNNKLIPKMSRAVCACLPATPNSLTDPGGAKMQNQFQE